jgi:hypothetical protein
MSMVISKKKSNTVIVLPSDASSRAYKPTSFLWVYKSDPISYKAFLQYVYDKVKKLEEDKNDKYNDYHENSYANLKLCLSIIHNFNRDSLVAAYTMSKLLRKTIKLIDACELKIRTNKEWSKVDNRKVYKLANHLVELRTKNTNIMNNWVTSSNKPEKEKITELEKFKEDSFLYEIVGSSYNKVVDFHKDIVTDMLSTEDKYFLNEVSSSYLPTVYSSILALRNSREEIVEKATEELASQLSSIVLEMNRIKNKSDELVLQNIQLQAQFLKDRTNANLKSKSSF